MKKTKVVCTIGPASEQKDCLEKLIGVAGMNVMRMNFSHGDYDEQGFRIKNVKELNKEIFKAIEDGNDLSGVNLSASSNNISNSLPS